MSTRSLSTIYFTIGIIFIALETIQATWPAIIIKALIMPVLILIYYRFIRNQMNGFHRMILSAFIFSWFGDIILQLQQFNDLFFMTGLCCFLIAQVLYLIVFFSTPGRNVLFFRRIYLVLPVLAYGIILLYFIYDGLEDMRIPVIIYAVVILTMLTAALNRQWKVNKQSYLLVLTGAVLFVLSDSLIAIDKFAYPFLLARIAIMTTYIMAQYLIAVGCLKQFEIQLE